MLSLFPRFMAHTLGLLLLAAGCGDDDAGPPGPGPCPEGYQADGPACVPRFDACSGSAEIPVLGGGCQRVGVTACATGFASDDEGGCTEVLPAAPCPPGSREALGDVTCRPVGVTSCASGFVTDGAGGCAAVLPETVCPEGTLESLGSTTCAPLDDCGAGPWGSVVTDVGTVHVDSAYPGADADGTAGRPFPTLAAGIAAAPEEGQVVVAAGEYAEDLALSRPVHLAGRCASLVTLRGVTIGPTDRPALRVQAGASGSTVQGVTLRGPGEGLVVAGADLQVKSTQVLDTGATGIVASAGATVGLERVVVARARAAGIAAIPAALTLVDTVVKETRADGDGTLGHGLYLRCDATGCGTLVARRAVIDASFDAGLILFGTGGLVEDSVIRGPRPGTADGGAGWGIGVFCDDAAGCADVEVSGSEVTGNREQGIVFASSAALRIRGTTIRGTGPLAAGQSQGNGMTLECDEVHGCGEVSLIDSSVTQSVTFGLLTTGLAVEFVGSQVVGTRAKAIDGTFGWGIVSACSPAHGVCGALTLVDSLVAEHLEYGISVAGPDVQLRRSTIRDVLESDSVPVVSAALDCACDDEGSCGTVSVSESVLLRNQSNGLSFSGCSAQVVASAVLDGLPSTHGVREMGGIDLYCDPAGRCGDLLVEGSLVARNVGDGVIKEGAGSLEVRETVVRDQRARTSGWGGTGVSVVCDLDGAGCAVARVTSSVIRGNHIAGVYLSGADLALEGSIVRDTEVRETSGLGGMGVIAGCDVDQRTCGTLVLTDSLLLGNHGVGLLGTGAQLSARGAHVRGTLPDAQASGIGVAMGCNLDLEACSSLDLRESTLRDSQVAGVYVWGGEATFTGVEVVGVSPSESGANQGENGLGVMCGCLPGPGSGPVFCGTCVLDSSLVADVHLIGVLLEGASGSAHRVVIREVAPQEADGRFGYGLQVAALAGGAPATFDVSSCRISEAALAGILYDHSLGTISDTTVEGADFSIVWTHPALAPTLAGDNQLSGDLKSDPSLQTAMVPAPAPPPPQPSPPEPLGE